MKPALLAAVAVFCVTAACNRTARESASKEGSARNAAALPAQSGEWRFYNGDSAGDRYSTLLQITAQNVSQRKPVCVFDTNDTISFQSGLVAANGALYATAFNNTYAIDPATCAQKWRHSRPEPPTLLNVNRGVGDSDGRLFRLTGDAHIVAIDANTGRTAWDVALGDSKKEESTPLAPIAWQGLVFAGVAGGDNFGVVGRIYALARRGKKCPRPRGRSE